MKKIFAALFCATLLGGCASSSETFQQETKTVNNEVVNEASEQNGNYTNVMKMDNSDDSDPQGGADTNERTGDHENSKYYYDLDFFNMSSNDTLTILKNYKTYQQTNEYSCGVCAAIMALDHFGILGDDTEKTISEKYQAGIDGTGTNLRQLKQILEDKGLKTYSTFDIIGNIKDPSDYYNYFTKDMVIEKLKNGEPIIICISEWGGHWVTIIGYDNMGTDDEKDDVLIIADSYDTSDHNQDGYGVMSYQRLIYNYSVHGFFPEEELNDFLFIVPSKEQQ